MKYSQQKILAAQDMSANFNSPAMDLRNMFAFSFQAKSTTAGTLGGTFKLQASNDYTVDSGGRVTNAGNWRDLAAPAPVVIAAAGTIGLDQSPAPGYLFVRLVYTKAGGDTGNCDVWFNAKGF